MPVIRDDPYPAYNFLVEIEGVARAGFTEVSGLDQEIDVVAYREGSDRTTRLFPARPRPVAVTLRRGITGDLALVQWFRAARDGDLGAARRPVRIVLLDEAREAVMSWGLRNAFPSRLEGPRLDAASSAVAIETLVLRAEDLAID